MNNQVISFHYTLTDPHGKQLDSSAKAEPLTFIEGQGQIIPGLETHLTAMKVGDKKRVTVAAREAYGERDTTRVVNVPRDKFPAPDVAVGNRYRVGDGRQNMVVTVTAVTDQQVTMDGNHPLAGVDLTFDVELVAKRAATEADLECCHGTHHHDDGCGHDHGDGCCGKHQH
jgi:FKBP-type peptidyl-prolyl cis-trans isomerase SlyD